MHGGPWLLGASGLQSLLDELAAEGGLIGPVDVGGETVFAPVARAEEDRKSVV